MSSFATLLFMYYLGFPMAVEKIAPHLPHAWWQAIVIGSSAIAAVSIATSWWKARAPSTGR